MKNVLLIDDQAEEFAPIWRLKLEPHGLRLHWQTDPTRTAEACRQIQPDAALVDIFFAEPSGVLRERAREVIDLLRGERPALPIVLLTSKLADASVRLDPEAQYPEVFRTHPKELLGVGPDPAVVLARILTEAIAATGIRWDPLKFGIVTGASPAIAEVMSAIERIAPLGSNVLLVGETGTGKELVARALHGLSGRMGRFEPLNCGTVTDTLAESRLFGTRKGGFSGAPYSEGVFELADKGTLFLDEVQSAPMVVQNMLVRVIEDGRVTPVGGTTKSVDVRVIAASNRDLEALVASGAFREDLLQRLKATVIRLPPLRDRLDDIPALFSHWVTRLNSELPHPCLDMLRGDVRELLQSNLWPGNIREFIAALRDAMLRSRSGVLQPTHFGRATADKPLNDSALTDGLIDFAGLAQQVLAGDVPWQEAMQLQGEYKKELLREVISLHIAQTGSYSHKALAERLTTTSANLRKLCSTYEVYPPRDPKHTRRKEK